MAVDTISEAGERRHEPFRLAGFLVEPKRNRLTGPEGPTSLQPRIVDVLCAFAERPGEVLSRSELIDWVWGVEHGADESLTRAISLLRKVIGDGVIETIPKRGYRLAAAPQPVAAPERQQPRAKRPLRWMLPAAALVGLALLSAWFLLRDRKPTLPSARTGIVVTVDAFGSGLGNEIAASLARSPLVRVRTKAGSDPPGTLPYVLRGDIRRVGPTIEAGAQLVDSASGELVWSARYRRPWDEAYSARDALAGAVSADLLLPLLRDAKQKIARRPILALQPWELILLVTWVPGDEVRPAGPPTENAYWLQRRALELDPDFAPAHALFAELAAYHALFDPPYDKPRMHARARRHAERAIELAPYDAEILYQVALYHRFSGQRREAEALLQRVIELQPDHPLAGIELAFVRGQCATDSDAALARLTGIADSLAAASPARWVALSHLSSLHLGRGDYRQARAAALRSREIIPMTWTGFSLAAAEAALGRRGEAVAALAAHRREWPNMDLAYFADHVAPRWCLHGPRAAAAQASFRRLAAMARAPR